MWIMSEIRGIKVEKNFDMEYTSLLLDFCQSLMRLKAINYLIR